MLEFIVPTPFSLAIEGNTIKLANKNQIYLEPGPDGNVWVLEMFEGTNEYTGSEEELFSVFDAYSELEEAIKIGEELSSATYLKIRDRSLRNR